MRFVYFFDFFETTGHCDGKEFSIIWMWAKELVVTYHQRLMQLLSETDLGNVTDPERPRKLQELSKMSNALVGLCR